MFAGVGSRPGIKPTWSVPRFCVYAPVNITLTAGGWTNLSLALPNINTNRWAKVIDSHDCINTSSVALPQFGNGRFMVPMTGLYNFAMAWTYSSAGLGTRISCGLEINNGTNTASGNGPQGPYQTTATTTDGRVTFVVEYLQLNAGDFVEFWGYNAAGTTPVATAGRVNTWWSGTFVCPI